MVFIVEPVFWIALGVPLATMVARRESRWLLFMLLAAAPAYATLRGYLQWGSLAGLAALGLLLGWAERRPGVSCRRMLAAGFAAAMGYVAVQGVAVGSARRLATAQLALRDPGGRVLDVALSAFPANPLCWAFAVVEANEGAGSYRLRRGVLSLAPAVTAASACPARLGGAPRPVAGGAALAWLWEERGSLAVLRDLRRNNCHLDAWLRFARAPSLVAGTATDIRFGPPGSPNFSTLPYAALAGTPCPSRVPGWGYPRADLLGLP
jgi:inner membrane protein